MGNSIKLNCCSKLLIRLRQECEGQVDKLGNLHRQDCTPSFGSKRVLTGSIIKVELGNTGGGLAGDITWLNNDMAGEFCRVKQEHCDLSNVRKYW